MSTKLDIPKIRALLSEVQALDEKIADRGPIKLLPRPSGDIPDVPKLRARLEEIQTALRVKRKGTVAKGHDLLMQDDGAGGTMVVGPIPGRDLKAVGILEQVRAIKKGEDRALPDTNLLVRVHFPGSGDHLWFDPDDIQTVDAASEASKP